MFIHSFISDMIRMYVYAHTHVAVCYTTCCCCQHRETRLSGADPWHPMARLAVNALNKATLSDGINVWLTYGKLWKHPRKMVI